MTVLDSSALLAYLRNEQGADAVEQALAEAGTLGAVNLAEVLSKLADAGEDPESAMPMIGVLPLEIVPFDEDMAVEAARLRPITARIGLSLGDRACLALAQLRDEDVLTADAAWKTAKVGVTVRVIR